MSYGLAEYAGGLYGGPRGGAPSATDTEPALAVEVAFTTDPLAEPAWVDITTDVRSWDVQRGRNRELERFQPGRATVVLSNLDRDYDSQYDAGPWFGFIKPMRRIRIRETFNGVTYPTFDGFVDRWQLDYPNTGKDAVCVVTATDGFKVHARNDLGPSVYHNAVRDAEPVGWWRLGKPAYIVTEPDNTDGGRELTYTDNPRGGQSLVTNDQNPSTFFDHPDEGNGNVVEGTVTTPIPEFPFTIEAVFRSQKQADNLYRILVSIQGNGSPANRIVELAIDSDASMTPGQLLFALSDDAGVTGSVTVGGSRVDDGRIHHVAVVVESSTFATIYLDGVDDTSFDAPDTVLLPSGTVQVALGNTTSNTAAVGEFGLDGELGDVALYDYALGPATIAEHADLASHPWQGDLPGERIDRVLDTEGWPADLRELDPGVTTFQSADIEGPALEHLQKTSETEFGLLFQGRTGKVRFVDRNGVFGREPDPAVLGDDSGEVGYRSITFDDGDTVIRNRATISRLNGAAKTAQDADSIEEFGPFDYVLQGLLHDTESYSQDYANLIRDEYKDPRRRVTGLSLGPAIVGEEADVYPMMLSRELGDAVIVRHTPPGGGDRFEQTCVIEGVRHAGAPGGVRTCDWMLSPEFAIRELEDEEVATLGYAEVTANQGSITTEVDLTSLTTTVTVGTGRRVRITGDMLAASSVAGDLIRLQVKEGASVLMLRQISVVNTNSENLAASIVLTPSAGSHTYKLSLQRAAGTGNVTMVAGAGFPAFILVEDIGPA